MTQSDAIRALYAQTAFLYEARIIPAFGQLAGHLAAWIVRCADALAEGRLYDPFDLESRPAPQSSHKRRLPVLDVGTGTGILARALAASFGEVTGVDLAPAMLRVARQVSGAAYVAGDLHHLPFRRGAFGLVTSSFGLNASSPREALRSLARVLRPGGLLIFQEWGAEDSCAKIVNDTLAEFAPEHIPGLDPALQAYFEMPKPWYEKLQDVEDYYQALKKSGFELVWVREAPFCTVHLESVNAFLAFKLSWPARRLPLEAMTPEARDACGRALRARLAPYTNPDGSFDWSPPLFRVCAVREHLG